MSENLASIFFNQATASSNRVALRKKVQGEYIDITWKEYGEKVRALASMLLDMGVSDGDRVAIFSYNSPEWAYTDIATITLRAIVVPIYFKSTASQVEFILRDSGATVIMVGDVTQRDIVLSVKENLPHLKYIICTESNSNESVMSFSEALRRGAASPFSEEIKRRMDAITADDISTIVYTSGTTGEPKGVMLTHRNLLANIRSDIEIAHLTPDDVGLSFLPTSHVLDKVTVHYMNIVAGGTVAYAESLDTVLTDIQLTRPTALCGVPRMFEKIYNAIHDSVNASPSLNKKLFQWAFSVGRRVILKKQRQKRPGILLNILYAIAEKLVYKRIKKLFGGRLRLFASGGSHLREDIDMFFRILNIPILHGYGLTEATCTVTINSFDDFQFETLGHPLPGVRVSISDDGEILVKGELVMKGYYNRPEETAQALRDGWLYTGDIGLLNEDGYLIMTDRKKALMKTSGSKYISPQRIETMVMLSRFVEQVVVIAEGRRFPTLLIVPSFEALQKYCSEKNLEYSTHEDLIGLPEITALFQGIVDQANDDLESFEKIKRFSLLPEEFTFESGALTHTLKVKRRIIEQQFRDIIDRMYE